MSFGCTGCRRIRFLARGIVVHDALLLRWSVPSAPRVARADRRDRALWRHACPANSEHPVYLWSDTRWRARGQFIARSHSAMLWTCSISSATASNRALHERDHREPGSEPRRSTTTLPFSAQSTKACRGVGRGCQLVRSTFSKCASAAGSLQPLIAA